MGLIKKLFGRDHATQPGAPASSQFHESETTTEQGSKNAPRREMVQVVLRDTMRKHGIPSDWIECRILSVMSRSAMAGMHVHLLVRKGDDRLLTYVHAFQNSFRSEIVRFDPNAPEWLLSVAWQFEGNEGAHAAMPNPASWTGAGTLSPEQEQQDREQQDQEDVSEDLAALFAIRDAALSGVAPDSTGGHADFQPTQPGEDLEPAGPGKR